MPETSGEIARRLAKRAEDVCRCYLPNGKRVGAYWIAGDIRGAKGRSLFVRLAGPSSGKGAAGKWNDYVALRVMLRQRYFVHFHRRWKNSYAT